MAPKLLNKSIKSYIASGNTSWYTRKADLDALLILFFFRMRFWAQVSLLTVLGEQYMVLGIVLGLAVCKANALSKVSLAIVVILNDAVCLDTFITGGLFCDFYYS